MSETRVELNDQKSKNRLFICGIHDIASHQRDINALLDTGWLIEKTEIVGNSYVMSLCKKHKVFYVDVSHLSSDEVGEYMDKVRHAFEQSDGETYYIPVR